jgi:hypothetical protein
MGCYGFQKGEGLFQQSRMTSQKTLEPVLEEAGGHREPGVSVRMGAEYRLGKSGAHLSKKDQFNLGEG